MSPSPGTLDFVQRLRSDTRDPLCLQCLFEALRKIAPGLKAVGFWDAGAEERQKLTFHPRLPPGDTDFIGNLVAASLPFFLSAPDPVLPLPEGRDETVFRLSQPGTGLAGFLVLRGEGLTWLSSESRARQDLFLLAGHWHDHLNLTRAQHKAREASTHLGIFYEMVRRLGQLREESEILQAAVDHLARLLNLRGIVARIGPPGEARMFRPMGATPHPALYDQLTASGAVTHPLVYGALMDHPLGGEHGSVFFGPLLVGEHWRGVLEAPFEPHETLSADRQVLLNLVASQVSQALLTASHTQALEREGRHLHEANFRLQQVLSGVPVGLVVVSGSGTVRMFNETMAMLCHCELAEDVNYHRCLPESFAREMDRLFDQNVDEAATEFVFKDRSLKLTVRAMGGGGDSLVVVQDLSSLKELASLKELDRMKSDFVSAASHELRTPLTSIQGFVQTLLGPKGGKFSTEKRREFYRIILEEAERLKRLIENMLDVARIESGAAMRVSYVRLELWPFLEKLLRLQAERDASRRYVLDTGANPVTVKVDDMKLDHILTNLLGNAAKYSPPGSMVVLGLRDEEDGVLLWVQDNGPGVPSQDVPSLFQRFFRGSQEGAATATGTGLGLYLVRQLVQAHGGSIWYEDVPGGGAKFVVRLPKPAAV